MKALIFLALCLSALVLHEVSHFVCCRLLKLTVVGFKLPFLVLMENKTPCFKFTKNFQSFCKFLSSNKKKTLAVTLTGPVFNLLFGIILLIISKNLWIFLSGIYSLFIFIYNLLPVAKGDGALILKLFKEQ